MEVNIVICTHKMLGFFLSLYVFVYVIHITYQEPIIDIWVFCNYVTVKMVLYRKKHHCFNVAANRKQYENSGKTSPAWFCTDATLTLKVLNSENLLVTIA